MPYLFGFWFIKGSGGGLRKEEERFLSAQAEAFPTGSESPIAGANAGEKIGLLRSK